MSPTPETDNTFAQIMGTISTPGGLMLAAFCNPDTFPQVKIGGESYELRLSLRASIFLEKQYKIPSHDLAKWMGVHYENRCVTAMTMILAGAMVGRQIGGKWIAMPLTDEQMADRLLPEETIFIAGCYRDALGKVSEAVTSALSRLKQAMEPVPTPIPTPTAEVIQ